MRTPRRSILLGLEILLLAAGLLAMTACETGRTPEERLYRKHCSQCHGIDGSGNTPAYMGDPYADLTDEFWRSGSGGDDSVRRVIREGVFGKMPGFTQQLTGPEVEGLVKHMRSLRSGTAR